MSQLSRKTYSASDDKSVQQDKWAKRLTVLPIARQLAPITYCNVAFGECSLSLQLGREQEAVDECGGLATRQDVHGEVNGSR